jgi:hypothetical protein
MSSTPTETRLRSPPLTPRTRSSPEGGEGGREGGREDRVRWILLRLE